MMSQIQCNPTGVEFAENLRTLAELIERGEVTGIAVCVSYPAEDNDRAMGSSFWVDPKHGDLLRLVGATHLLAARVTHGFGVPETAFHFHEDHFSLGQLVPKSDPEDEELS
jgi:hypothetical protein